LPIGGFATCGNLVGLSVLASGVTSTIISLLIEGDVEIITVSSKILSIVFYFSPKRFLKYPLKLSFKLGSSIGVLLGEVLIKSKASYRIY
jgi:hypothetical protein